MISTCTYCRRNFRGSVRCTECGHFYGDHPPIRDRALELLQNIGLAALAIFGFFAFMVGVAIADQRKMDRMSREMSSQEDMELIVRAADEWTKAHEGKCPVMSDLGRVSAPGHDAWRTPFRIECPGAYEVEIRSAGNDQAWGTRDDLRVFAPSATPLPPGLIGASPVAAPEPNPDAR